MHRAKISLAVISGETPRATPRRLVMPLLLAVMAGFVLGGALAVPPRALAAETYLEGIDVSRWQGKPRWADVKAAGVRFVIARATAGTVTSDPNIVDLQWTRNRTKLRNVGIAFSAYHYAGPDMSAGDAVEEADHFVDTAGLNGKNLLPVLDIERHNNMSAAELIEWTKAWLARVEERLGVKPMIYTDRYFWQDHMADTTWFANHGYRLWIAHWTEGAEPTLPANNWGGNGWTLWQYAVKCCVSGIEGKVDRDRYNGDSLAPLRIKNNR